MISFLLLILGFFFVLLSLIALGVRLGCLFEIVLVSWGRIALLSTSLLELLLLHPLGFGLSCFHCHLFLGIFWLPLWFLQWSLGYLVAHCLAFMYLCFTAFFPVIDFQSHSVVVRKDAWYDFNFLKFTKAWFVTQDMTYPGERSMSTWEKSVFCCFWMECPINFN